MDKKELIKKMNIEYPPNSADEKDFIGLQVDGKEEINKIIITLDITFDVIYQAISSKTNMIISHHPLIFGAKDDVFQNNKIIKAKYKVLKDNNINVFIIHTNADWNINSISKYLGEKMDLLKIENIENNNAIKGCFKEKKKTLHNITHSIKKIVNLKYVFRTNISDKNISYSELIIASGASGYLVFNNIVNGKNIVYYRRNKTPWMSICQWKWYLCFRNWTFFRNNIQRGN